MASFRRLGHLQHLTRTTLSLGGGLMPSIRLAWHVLRTEGIGGIAWRLRNARNIADGRVDPWRHFFLDGSRQKPFGVERFEQLWSGEDESLLSDLHALLGHRNRLLGDTAAWTLARWFARHERWLEALEVMQPAIAAHGRRAAYLPLGIKLLWTDAQRHTNHQTDALQFLDAMESTEAGLNRSADLTLARANVLRQRSTDTPTQQALADRPTMVMDWLATINQVYASSGLAGVALINPEQGIHIDNLETLEAPSAVEGPLVSVIVPAYNASTTLATVLRSLCAQTWQALEILVVDDCSSDDTVALAREFAVRDARIRLIQLPRNAGAYEARNTGAEQARGEYITVHDSDDWSHAQKIEKQVRALLEQPRKLISFSHWARASDDLIFGSWQHVPTNWHQWVHRNTSSLMMRRSVFERLGYWDNVRCSADAEYYYRALRVYGVAALVEVLPGIPLSFGRVSEGSLTQHSDTSLFTLFGGLRRQYHNAFEKWHQEYDPNNPHSLHLPRHPSNRPFPVPEGMLRQRKD